MFENTFPNYKKKLLSPYGTGAVDVRRQGVILSSYPHEYAAKKQQNKKKYFKSNSFAS